MYLPSLLKSKVPELPCPEHPDLTIHSLCFQAGCSTPYICANCEAKHPKDHSHAFIAIRNVYEDKTLIHHAEALSCDFSLEKIGSTKDKMIIVLRKIEDEFRQTISKMIELLGDSFERLKIEVQRRIGTLETFEQIKKSLKDSADDKCLKDLVKTYSLVKQDYNEHLTINLESQPSTFMDIATVVLKRVQDDLSSWLDTNVYFRKK